VRRPARNALTVLLMLPLAAAAVLWMRSLSCYDRLECSPLTDRPGEFRSDEFTLQGSRGVLGVSYVRHDFKQPSSPDPLDASLYTQQYNRVLRQHASEGDHGGWAWKSEPSREFPFAGRFTGRTFREADAVHRGWGVEWTTPYGSCSWSARCPLARASSRYCTPGASTAARASAARVVTTSRAT
jgi:hypothetical protein